MKAMLSRAPGGPETLELTDLPTPAPDPDQILVRIRAAGVNYPDTLIIRDRYQFRPPRPFAPGGEFAGEVAALGKDVSGFAVGDRVLGLGIWGGFATHICVKARDLVKIPDAMPFDEAACFLLTYATSHHALKDCAALKKGETLLILGAAGGVGAAAIELGVAAGARVIAAVSSADKAAFCRDLGAHDTLIYPRELDRDGQKALSAQFKQHAPDGVDVVYDAVGGDYAEPAIRALAWEGRFLVVGFPAGIPKMPLNLALLKGARIIGVFWGEAVARDPERHERNMAELFTLHQAGRIKPRISVSLPLQEAGKALTLLENREVMGKIVLIAP